MYGSNWPNNGEIDIIEGVNGQSVNQMALHTSDGCSIGPLGYTGTLLTPNCYVQAPGQSINAGCAIKSTSDSSYGDGFNKAGGGVYATEWTGQAISIWFFPASSVPSDIRSGRPNPLGWGLPTARFAGACDIDSHFRDQRIVRHPFPPIHPHSTSNSQRTGLRHNLLRRLGWLRLANRHLRLKSKHLQILRPEQPHRLQRILLAHQFAQSLPRHRVISAGRRRRPQRPLEAETRGRE